MREAEHLGLLVTVDWSGTFVWANAAGVEGVKNPVAWFSLFADQEQASWLLRELHRGPKARVFVRSLGAFYRALPVGMAWADRCGNEARISFPGTWSDEVPVAASLRDHLDRVGMVTELGLVGLPDGTTMVI